MRSIKSPALTSACLMASALVLSACGGASNLRIPDSLRAPCASTVDTSNAQTVGDLGNAIIAGDGDLRVCSTQKDAVVFIAESRNKAWWEVWK